MIKENTIEGYFNLDEPNDLGDTYHSGSWSKDHLDPTNTWGNGMCFVYYNRNCSFKLKQEIWQKYTSKIIKLSDMELLTNDTPFSDAEVKEALHQKWFAENNEEIRLANNRKARMRRAKQKEIAQ